MIFSIIILLVLLILGAFAAGVGASEGKLDIFIYYSSITLLLLVVIITLICIK